MFMWNRLTRQYLVCPPRTSVTALILLCMEFIRACILLMGILSHSSNKAALIWSRVGGGGGGGGGIPTPPYSPVHFVPQMFHWGQIWTVWRPIEWVNVKIAEKILTLWLHGAGHYPAGKLGDDVAQMELQPAGGFHPYILHLLNYRLSQSTATLTSEISLPRP